MASTCGPASDLHQCLKACCNWAADYFVYEVLGPATLFNVTFPNIDLRGDNGSDAEPESVQQFRFTASYWTVERQSINPPTNLSAPRSLDLCRIFDSLFLYWTLEKRYINPPTNLSGSAGTYQYCPCFVAENECSYFVDLVQHLVQVTSDSIQLKSTDAFQSSSASVDQC
jgi:hypothetical protein